MSWVLLTGATGPHEELLEISWPSLKVYADRWGMDLMESALGDEFPASWYKIPAIAALLPHHEGVIWIDADAVVVEPSVDIRAYAAKPWNWVVHHLGEHVPNCGVLVLKNDPRVFEFLADIWALRDTYRDHPWWEQAAAIEVQSLYADIINELPLRFNVLAGRTPCSDAVIYHAASLAGRPWSERVDAMNDAADRVSIELP